MIFVSFLLFYVGLKTYLKVQQGSQVLGSKNQIQIKNLCLYLLFVSFFVFGYLFVCLLVLSQCMYACIYQHAKYLFVNNVLVSVYLLLSTVKRKLYKEWLRLFILLWNFHLKLSSVYLLTYLCIKIITQNCQQQDIESLLQVHSGTRQTEEGFPQWQKVEIRFTNLTQLCMLYLYRHQWIYFFE